MHCVVFESHGTVPATTLVPVPRAAAPSGTVVSVLAACSGIPGSSRGGRGLGLVIPKGAEVLGLPKEAQDIPSRAPHT